MHKFLVAAALSVSIFAVPSLPANAAPLLSDGDANCLVFGFLKKECWERGAAVVEDSAEAVVVAASDTVDTAADVADDAADAIVVPWAWWNCTAAPSGSGHLLDC